MVIDSEQFPRVFLCRVVASWKMLISPSRGLLRQRRAEVDSHTVDTTDIFHEATTFGRYRVIAGGPSAGPKALLGVSLMCPPGNEKDRFPLFRGNYVIPISSGKQNSRFPLFCGSLMEKVNKRDFTPTCMLGTFSTRLPRIGGKRLFWFPVEMGMT